MKKKCANGGVVKKPMTMQEQLASVRGKVRPGYASGGIPGIDEPVSLSGNFLSRQPIESGIGATAIQSGEYPVNAPGSTPQSLGTLGKPDYSTGPRQGGFVYEDGTPRPTQQAAAQNPLADQISSGQALANLSNTERYKLGGSGTSAEASAINAKNDILQGMNASIAKSNPVQSFVSPEQPVQQIQGSRRRRNSQPQGMVSFASGGPVFRDGNTFSDRPLMPEPGNYPQRIANPRPMPRPVAAPQPVKIPLPPPEYPQERVKPAPVDSGAPVGTYQGVTGIADAIINRKVKNAEAEDYAAGGMVRFAGPGGPRDDQIPVKVAGAEINVSNGENAVILPAKTAANPAALQAINGIIQATNDGRKPKAGIEDGGKYQAGAYPARIVPDEIDLIRGRLETARAQAQDAASRSAYKGELATRDAMTARAAEQANMQAALESAKSQPAINPRAVPAQPIYRPNWTSGNNAPVLEGTVETAADRAARTTASAPRALPAPQPGTAIVPRTIDWTPGGNPSAGGPLQARSVDWTYGESGGPRQGIASSAQPQQAPRALPAPAQPVSAGATPVGAAPAQPAASSMTGKSQAYKAGYAYQKAGGLTGIAGKALNVIAPATAAYQALGDNAIRVQGFRESDPGYDEQSGTQRLGTAAQQVALTAGDWGTKGIDVLGGWALPKDQPSFNDLYRERVGLLPGVTAPTTRDVALTEAERNVAPIVAKRSQQAAQQAEQQAQQQPNKGIAAATGNSGAIQRNGLTTTQMGRGFDPTKLTMADGYGMATNAAGKTISVGPSEYVGADGKPTSRWTDTAAYKDAIARNERDKIRLAEMQAVRLGANPQQALQASQGIAQAAQQSGLAAQQAGQAQQTQQFAIDKAAREQSLIDAWDKAGTPEQKQTIAWQLNVLRNNQKQKPEEFDNMIVKEYNDLGSVVGERVVQMPKNREVQQGQASTQQSFKTPDEVEAARKAGKVKSGDVVLINGRQARIN